MTRRSEMVPICMAGWSSWVPTHRSVTQLFWMVGAPHGLVGAPHFLRVKPSKTVGWLGLILWVKPCKKQLGHWGSRYNGITINSFWGILVFYGLISSVILLDIRLEGVSRWYILYDYLWCFIMILWFLSHSFSPASVGKRFANPVSLTSNIRSGRCFDVAVSKKTCNTLKILISYVVVSCRICWSQGILDYEPFDCFIQACFFWINDEHVHEMLHILLRHQMSWCVSVARMATPCGAWSCLGLSRGGEMCGIRGYPAALEMQRWKWYLRDLP